MRRGAAAMVITLLALAPISAFPFRNNCCCKVGCPMKRVAKCGCTLSAPIVIATIAVPPAILAQRRVTFGPQRSEQLESTALQLILPIAPTRIDHPPQLLIG